MSVKLELGAPLTLHFASAFCVLSEWSYMKKLRLGLADMWRKHPQETALTPLHRPPKFKCGDTVLFRDDSAVIRVGDIQEYSMGKPRP